MYCRIIPLGVDGGDHVMLIVLPTNVTSEFSTNDGAENIKRTDNKLDNTNILV